MVNMVEYNFQDWGNRGIGYCVIITFDPITRNISFTDYSALHDDYNYYENTSRETFVLENAF